MNSQKNSEATVSNAKRKAKNDMVLIVAFLLVIAIAALVLFLFRTEGDTVTVLLDGQVFGEYPLSEDRSIEVRVGDNYNVIVIENGQARVSEASCPDGICAAHRPVGYDGESIICLPNKVVVEIRTENRNQPDIIV